MIQTVSVSHLFRPLVHSWPLRTVIKVEQYVLTATRLHRGETERENRECIDPRGGSETVWDLYDKNCFQSLQATTVKQDTGKRRQSRRTKQTSRKIERGREKGVGDRKRGRGGYSRNSRRKESREKERWHQFRCGKRKERKKERQRGSWEER